MSTIDAGTDADTAGGGSTDKAKAEAGEGEGSAEDEAEDGKDSTSGVDDMDGEAQPDYYGLLGVPEEATPTEIKVCSRPLDTFLPSCAK